MNKFFLLAVCLQSTLFAQTIAEKKASFEKKDHELSLETSEELKRVNSLVEEKRFELRELYDQAYEQHLLNPKGEFHSLLKEIKVLKAEIAEIQKMWKDETVSLIQSDDYALWHQPESTIQELVLDYGSSDYIYLLSPDIGSTRISINSNLPIPREAWGECLELILAQYGIGVRELNPYLRELYLLQNDPTGVKEIVQNEEELDFFPHSTKLTFMLTPSDCDPKGDLRFLQKFSNPITTKIESLGGKIFITSSVDNIQELLKLYGFAKSSGGRQDFQLITLSKIDAKEMETILLTAFHDGKVSEEEGSSLRVLPLQNLSQSLFLSGSKDEVKKAIQLIHDVESQIEDPQEKTVFWYVAKHSDAEELASVLAKVYDLLVHTPHASIKDVKLPAPKEEKKKEEKLAISKPPIGTKNFEKTSHKTADGQNNFIVDPKTSTIIMVVEQEALPKIKELLKKLDVPKKMVQLEVLLFEKKVSNQSKVGLNLLRIGQSAASTAAGWAFKLGNIKDGILEFLFSHSKGSGIPAYDFAYQFLLGQEDVQINASPSVTTMNQTPAMIAVMDETSIDSGADEKHNHIYSRQQYGINIQITPTINFDENGQETTFITLDTDILFDSPKKSNPERPEVARRVIKNHVRIADGETLILGGLRHKNIQDSKEGIPFLCEIPGIGKLFSHTEMTENSTEMFVFITPKIIWDPIEDERQIIKEQMKKRPGDIPEYLRELGFAKDSQKRRLFEGSMTALFGRKEPERIAKRELEEYDGK